MDFLGYLISNREEPTLKDPKEPDPMRIIDYIEFFNDEDKHQISKHSDILVKVFRNGLAHQFFPKRAGVSRVNNELFTKSKEGGYLVLDAEILAKMFLKSIENLTIKSTKDDELSYKLYKRLKKFDDNSEKVHQSASTFNCYPNSSGASISLLRPSKGGARVLQVSVRQNMSSSSKTS